MLNKIKEGAGDGLYVGAYLTVALVGIYGAFTLVPKVINGAGKLARKASGRPEPQPKPNIYQESIVEINRVIFESLNNEVCKLGKRVEALEAHTGIVVEPPATEPVETEETQQPPADETTPPDTKTSAEEDAK